LGVASTYPGLDLIKNKGTNMTLNVAIEVRSVSALLLVLFAARGGAATLLSENFEELTPTAETTAAGQFFAASGTVDILGPGYYPELCVAPTAGNCIDLDGSTQGALQSNSIFTLQPGVKYYLSFDLIGSQRGVTTSTTVSLGNYSQTFTLLSGDTKTGVVQDQLIQVNQSMNSSLLFTSNTPGLEGAILDNVTLTEVPAVPLPASAWLMLGGVGGLGLFARKKRTGQSKILSAELK
jgi:hypothetical protein